MTMARMARWKLSGMEAWYHVHARIAGRRGEYPLAEPVVRRKLLEILEFYTGIYFCEVAAVCVMGNHYHLVVRFEAEREVSRGELEERARRMYPASRMGVDVGSWEEGEWERYRKRLFDLSEYMRNVQSAFGSWYNRTYERRGRFWGDRFKSVVLGDRGAVVDCMLYVDLNGVRAGLVERPEEWEGSSIYLREAGRDGWLLPLEAVIPGGEEKVLLREYRQRLYYRGSVPTREGQASIPQRVLDEEVSRGFVVRGMYRKRLGYWVSGVAVGGEGFIREQLARMREEGRYLRRRHPIPQLGGVHLSLREQRSNAVIF